MKKDGELHTRSNDRRGAATAPAQHADLTPRQQQILQLLSDGLSNKEIALVLGLTAGTVKQHLHALFRRLGVSNRTMAVVRGARRKVEPAGSGTAAELPAALRYARRLVTAVVLEPRAIPVETPEAAEAYERDILRLRETFRRHARNFDATVDPLPGGGMTAWFGRRFAHGDDAARAVTFVRSFMADGESGGLPCAIGLGTVPEVLGDGDPASLAFRAFRTATVLASFAQASEPLVCETTARMARLSPDAPSEGVPVRASALRVQKAPSASAGEAWGGLPFLDELEATAARGRCSWVAVESWPPDAGTRLLLAIDECLAARGLPVHRVWMPSPGCTEVDARVIDQLRCSVAPGVRKPSGESIDDIVWDLASRGAAVLLAHGIDALSMLKGALKAATLDRLRTRPLVIAGGVVPRSGAPQTAVRLLGAHPTAVPFSRLLRLAVPEDVTGTIEGIRPDVQAVLDHVSPFARAVARAAAISGGGDAGAIANALGATRAAVLAGCAELQRAGLAELDAETLRFRDDQTAGAVRATLVALLR